MLNNDEQVQVKLGRKPLDIYKILEKSLEPYNLQNLLTYGILTVPYGTWGAKAGATELLWILSKLLFIKPQKVNKDYFKKINIDLAQKE